MESQGWVDIENEYYNALKNDYRDNPEKLNKEFGIITQKLIEYLNTIPSPKAINQQLKDEMLSPIKVDERRNRADYRRLGQKFSEKVGVAIQCNESA